LIDELSEHLPKLIDQASKNAQLQSGS
jgi:hypothetical protein